MKNHLTSLDELIWKQFEKVTQYANQKYGWSKYDLAMVADGISSVVTMGAGLYYTIAGTILHESSLRNVGLAATAIGPVSYYTWKTKNRRQESEELDQMVQTEAVPEPVYNPIRPLKLASGVGMSSYSLHVLFSEEPRRLAFLFGAAGILAGISFVMDTFSNYFRSQIMTPPKKKKSVWSAIGERFSRRPKRQIPVQVPVEKYTTTIDDYVVS